MMAAFIVANRGKVMQAVLLGLSATLSHTAVVWAVAMAGLYFGRNWNAEATEPYFQVASAVLMIAVAVWMLWRTRRHQQLARVHERDHDRDHGHDYDEVKLIDTGRGVLRLEIFEQEQLPRFRVTCEGEPEHRWLPHEVRLETERPSGIRQRFNFVQRQGFFDSIQDIPEPHEFVAHLELQHTHHSHPFDVEFIEAGHHHSVADNEALKQGTPAYQDLHELAHANDIRQRFANRDVTTGQTVMFGLTGGLVSCPASITVLLLCLQLKKVALGATLVLFFSIGLALRMVASGKVAVLRLRHVSKRWKGFGGCARRAPYLSGALIVLVEMYVRYQGLQALAP